MSIGAQKASARVAAKDAVKIRAALVASIDARRVYAQYMETNPPITKDQALSRARARAWAIKNVSLDLTAYKKVLARHYADMYVLGQREALENMAKGAKAQKGPIATANTKPKLDPKGFPIFDPSFSINWDAWTPGNEGAAALLSAPGGLKELLGDIDVQSRGIEDYSHDLLGTALADGIARGDTPVQIANDIRDSLSSPERALTVAITEGQRAKIAANVDSYQANGVEQIEWTTNDPCPECEGNDGEIVNLGDDFPSGDSKPPVHPNCQCDVIPVMPDLSGMPNYDDQEADQPDDSEMAVVADLTKYNPDQERDERGRFGSGSMSQDRTAKVEAQLKDWSKYTKGESPIDVVRGNYPQILENLRNGLIKEYMDKGMGKNNAIAQARVDISRAYYYQGNLDQKAREEEFLARMQEEAKTDPLVQEDVKNYQANSEYGTQAVSDIMTNGNVTIALSERTLADVLDDGRFKNQFETKTSGGLKDIGIRKQGEGAALEVPVGVKNSERPIYGFLTTNDNPGIEYDSRRGNVEKTWSNIASINNSNVDQYGEIRIVLKDSVRENTTATIGDSLRTGALAENLTNPDPNMTQMGLYSAGIPSHMAGLPTADYIEAQIHGGVKISDIAAIYVPNSRAYSVKNLLEYRGLNIPVKIR
jgi:SPP1 gp7 family putative phage head morphogenesis protein